MKLTKKDLSMDTLAIHAGQEPDPSTGAIMTPIYQTSTFVQTGLGVHKGFEYARTKNPTRSAYEALVASLELEQNGAGYGAAFGSGVGATTTVLHLLQPGDHVIATDDLYGGTFRLFDKVFAAGGRGHQFSYVDMSDLAAFEAAFKP
ncbi:MAG: cystathionine gamma-synthase, partial [Proteobacteria bacterium]